MKKLEEIPKKAVFEAPEGYFEQLPSIVQSRVAQKESLRERFQWKPIFQYALPALLVAVGITWYLNAGQSESPEEMLANVSSYDIENYLSDADMTTEDLFEHIDFEQVQVDSMEFDLPVLDLNEAEMEEFIDELDTEI